MKRTTRFLMACALVASAATAAAAQPAKCEIDESIATCWERYQPAVDQMTLAAEAKARKETSDKADAALRKTASGLDLSSLGTAGTLLNTLSRSGLVATSGDGDDGSGNPTSIAYDFNFLLPAPIRDRNAQLKMILNTKPTLWEPLKELLPEDGRDEAAGKLEKQIGDGDDYTISFTYAPASATWGRSLKAHQGLLSELFQAVPTPDFGSALLELDLFDTPPVAAGGDDDRRSFEEFFASGDGSGAGIESMTFTQAAARQLAPDGGRGLSDQEVRDRAVSLRDQFERAARSEAAVAKAFDKAVEDARLERFAKLVNNQRQFSLSLERKERGPLVGPNETSFEFSYEQPLAPNINKLEKVFEERCPGGDRACKLAEFSRMASKKSVDSGDRFAVSLSWTEIGDFSIDRPDDGLVLTREGGERLKIELSYGRTFDTGPNDESMTPSRFELSASHENYYDDPDRQDRFVAAATYTIDFSDEISLPFGLVYASKPEYLAMQDVDEQFGTRFGIKFKIPGSEPGQ